MQLPRNAEWIPPVSRLRDKFLPHFEVISKTYPNAQYPQWQHLGSTWIAIYKDQDHGGHQVNTYYGSLGHQLERRIELSKQDVPQVLNEAIQNRYHISDYIITSYERPGQPMLYQIALNLKSGRTLLYTDEQDKEIPYKDP